MDTALRKLDRRTAEIELAVEALVRDTEAVEFERLVLTDSYRLARCVEGGLLPEARHLAYGLYAAAQRRARQRESAA